MTSIRGLAYQDSGTNTAALIERTVDLAFNRLRLGKDVSPEVIEQVVDLVGAGALDAAIDASAPAAQPQITKRRFDEQPEFSLAAWRKRHGLTD